MVDAKDRNFTQTSAQTNHVLLHQLIVLESNMINNRAKFYFIFFLNFSILFVKNIIL